MSSSPLLGQVEPLKTRMHAEFSSDPTWLLERRSAALDRYLDAPLPSRPRTPLRNRRLDEVPVFDAEPVLHSSVWKDLEPESSRLSLSGAAVMEASLSAEAKQKGLVFTDLRSALSSHEHIIKPHLDRSLAAEAGKFDALNQAWWQNGAFIYVPRHVHLAVPLTVVHHQSPEQSGFFPRTLIIMEEESELSLVDLYMQSGTGDPVRCIASILVQAVLGPSAVLRYGSIEELSPSTEAFVHRTANLEADAEAHWNVGTFGSALEISSQNTYLRHSGSQNHSVSVFFGSAHQHYDLEVQSVHQGTHTKSNIVGKGVMKGRARSVFTGVTDIKHGAVGTDARQKEQTLMLSDQARADAIPSLLIEENDVFAAHSASAGPVDRNAIYYLMSRGMTEREAVEMIVEGFLAPVIDSISLDDIRRRVWAAVREKVQE